MQRSAQARCKKVLVLEPSSSLQDLKKVELLEKKFTKVNVCINIYLVDTISACSRITVLTACDYRCSQSHT